MPRGDGTGPMRMGMTMGRGRGWRNQFYATGLTGRQRAYSGQPKVSGTEGTETLKERAAYLSSELEAVRSKLNELEQSKAK